MPNFSPRIFALFMSRFALNEEDSNISNEEQNNQENNNINSNDNNCSNDCNNSNETNNNYSLFQHINIQAYYKLHDIANKFRFRCTSCSHETKNHHSTEIYGQWKCDECPKNDNICKYKI